MSPEQLLERPLTPASDVYSLGMLGFELLLGRDALPGNSLGEQLDRLRTGYSVGSIGQIDSDLLNVILRMTARDPTQRYPSAAAALALPRSESDLRRGQR